MKSKLISAGFIVVLWSALILTSCSKDSGYGSGSNNNGTNNQANAVSIESMAYNPTSLNVKVGTNVTWTNNDNVDHTVTANDASFDSGNLKPGAKYTHTFSTAGTFPYHCTLHPDMKASVVAANY